MLYRLSYPHLQAIPFVKHVQLFATEHSLESAGNGMRTCAWDHSTWLQRTHNFLFSNSTPTPAPWSQAPFIETGNLHLGWNEGVVRNKSSNSHPPTGLWKERGQSRGLVSLRAALWIISLAFIKGRKWKDKTSAQYGIFLSEIREHCVPLNTGLWHLWPWTRDKCSSPLKWE